MSDCAVLILAGGTGVRVKSVIPKQYLSLGRKSVLRRAIEPFLSHPEIGTVRVVLDPDHRQHYETATAGLDLQPPIDGGPTRQQSARAGLEALSGAPPRLVLIHDAARPFVDRQVIDGVLSALHHNPAVLPTLPVPDTLKRVSGDLNLVSETIGRAGLHRAQTPQGFDFQRILEAHRSARTLNLTDDAAVAEQAGMEVMAVDGSEKNFKISSPEDLARAREHFRTDGEYRVGSGIDVHAFGNGASVTLCGVEIPHDHALAGHSDADVALHAVTDALLGAVAAGDIGEHFPPSDQQWRDAPSRLFAEHATRLVEERGGMICHIDVTIICTRPRIGPYRQAMRRSLADILALDEDRISIKATTTEGLGFTGRNEGIAAQANATVRLA